MFILLSALQLYLFQTHHQKPVEREWEERTWREQVRTALEKPGEKQRNGAAARRECGVDVF